MLFATGAGVGWTLPLYELALMTRRAALERKMRGLRFTLATPEPGPLAVFGTEGSQAVAELLASAGIEMHTGVHTHRDPDGTLRLTPGDGVLEADRVLALPVLEGPAPHGIAGHSGQARGDFAVDDGDGPQGLRSRFCPCLRPSGQDRAADPDPSGHPPHPKTCRVIVRYQSAA